MRWFRWVIGWSVIVGILAGTAWLGYAYFHSTGEDREFKLDRVTVGNLTVYIEATGTIEPEEVIDVGTQVAGMVKEFGRDPADANKPITFGTKVAKGTVLARLDDRLFRTRLTLAEASLLKAEADLKVLGAKLAQAERDWRLLQSVNPSQAITQQEYNTARAALETTQADYQRGKAGVNESKAVRDEAEINLKYTVIESPVSGVIVDRRVNVGQTVVASLNAPSLFLIATDLTRMQVWVSVNEADIGQIKPGQQARFTVDAFAGETFFGTVSQIRLNASMQQNVVTYTVVVDTPNADLRLLPYLSANLKFLVNKRDGVTLIPNAAIRYKPPADKVALAYRNAYESQLGDKGKAPAGADSYKSAEKGKGSARPEKKVAPPGTAWVVDDDGELTPVTMRLGATDGKRTEVLEILDGTLPENAEVVVGEIPTKRTMTVNPFAPPPIFGTKRGTGK